MATAPSDELPPIEAYASDDKVVQILAARDRPSDRPMIECRAGELSRIVMEAQDAMLAFPTTGIYQRGGCLVRIARLDHDVKSGLVTRPKGSAVILNLSKDFMTLILGRIASWVRFDRRKKALAQIDPPANISSTLLSMAGEWRLPVLTGLVTAPTLRADGSLLNRPGYDAASGLYAAFDPHDFPYIDPNPSEDDACEALKMLDDLFSEFVYLRTDQEKVDSERSAHSSVAIAALMTAATRAVLPTAPATGIDAAKQGSGKTTLAKVICAVVTGHEPPVLTLSDDESEFKKCLLAILMAGDACVLIDNVDKPVDSASLCAVLTSSKYSERLLGANQRITVPSSVTWLITGNHLEFVGDLTSRVMVAILDPEEERPESREFGRDVIEYALVNRGRLLAAALTVTLAYKAAGSPKVQQPPSRFSAWDSMVRKPLLWLKRPDPISTQENAREVDPVREGLIGVLHAWKDIFGPDIGTVKEVQSKLSGSQVLYPDALDAFLTVAGNKDGTINQRKLGKYLARSVRRIESGLRLNDAGEDPLTHRRRYFISEITRMPK